MAPIPFLIHIRFSDAKSCDSCQSLSIVDIPCFSFSTSSFFWQSTDDLKSIAVEAVLLLQGKINDEDDDDVTIRLLVPSKVIGCIIGKSGSIVNEIRKRTKADVHISKGEKPKCADANDELVEVSFKLSS